MKSLALRNFKSLAILLVVANVLCGSLTWAGNWNEHMNTINSLLGKMKSQEGEMNTLIEEKAAAKSPEQLKEVLKEIVTKYKALQETHKKFEEERHHIRFEHPEKGAEIDRKYRPLRLKTVDQMESELGIDRKIGHLKQKVETVYKTGDGNDDLSDEAEFARKKKKYDVPTPTPTPDDRPRVSY